MRDIPWFGPQKGRFLTPGLSGYDSQLVPWSHDPSRSAQLLEAAGFPGGAGLPVLVLGSGVGREGAVARIALDLAAVGIHTRSVVLASAEARRVFDDSGAGPAIDLFVGVIGTPVRGADPVGLLGMAEPTKFLRLAPELATRADAVLSAPGADERSLRFAELERAVLDVAVSIPLAEAPNSVSSGPMVLHGQRVDGWFDPVTGAWRLDRLGEMKLGSTPPGK